MASLEGVTLDRYQLQQLVGKGGMANVYRGYDTKMEREVAIKVFKRDDEELLHRFIREAQLMESLRHPHLMAIYDTGESWVDGVLLYYIVMPFMPGGTLRARLRRSPLPLAEACRYLREIADALDYIHTRGIIHRDIKSSNILLDVNGNSYLSDFGIARASSDATQLTTTGSVLGTVDYVAPELFEPHQRANELSDLYSLGVLLFEMVTGRLPFVAENQIALVAMHVNKLPPLPSSFVASVPPLVDRVVLRALEKQPTLRYASGKTLAEAFCRATTSRASDGGLLLQGIPVLSQGAPDTPTLVVHPPAPVVVSTPRLGSTSRDGSGRDVSVPLARSPRRRPSSEQAQFRVVTVIALLVLLAVIGPITYVLLTYNHPGGIVPGGQSGNTATISHATTPGATPNLTATAQAQAAAATAQAQNATATAIAGLTATAQAQAEATAGVIQTATAGATSYSDPLNNANSAVTQAANWDQDSHCAFQNDGYHVTEGVNLINFHGCLESGHSYQDATITVDMAINSGQSGGVFFRVNKSSILGVFSGYLFAVDNQGNYQITASKDFSNPFDTIVLQSGSATPAFKTGSAKNTLQVIVKGNTFLFYVNGTFLVKVQDSSYASGGVALLATTNGTPADIIYRNINIYPPAP